MDIHQHMSTITYRHCPPLRLRVIASRRRRRSNLALVFHRCWSDCFVAPPVRTSLRSSQWQCLLWSDCPPAPL